MANLTLEKISDARVYIDGTVDCIGKVRSLNLPQLSTETVTHEGLGLFGNPAMPVGLSEPEATFEWDSLYPRILNRAYNPFGVASLQVRMPKEFWNSNNGQTEVVPVVTRLRGFFKQMPFGSQSNNEKISDLSSTLSVYYLKQTNNGVVTAEVDLWSNIFNVAGEDVLAGYRRAMGG